MGVGTWDVILKDFETLKGFVSVDDVEAKDPDFLGIEKGKIIDLWTKLGHEGMSVRAVRLAVQ